MRRSQRVLISLVSVSAMLICGCEDAATTRARVFESQKQDTYARCLAHAALDNYTKQCERSGGKIIVVRHTFVCFDKDRKRNPQGMGDGPFCVCRERDSQGQCIGDADCDVGVHEKCDPLLGGELIPYYRAPAEIPGPPAQNPDSGAVDPIAPSPPAEAPADAS